MKQFTERKTITINKKSSRQNAEEKAKTVQWQSLSWEFECVFFQWVDMSFFNRIRPDPGFVSPVRSDPGFVSPIRSDPVRSDPGFVNGRSFASPNFSWINNTHLFPLLFTKQLPWKWITMLNHRVRNCDQLVANATENWVLATRISRLVAGRRLTFSALLMFWTAAQGINFVLNGKIRVWFPAETYTLSYRSF